MGVMKVELLVSRRTRARESSMKNKNISKFTALQATLYPPLDRVVSLTCKIALSRA
jgi:hypothetical protein